MSKIIHLTEDVYNMIAAGEVVENPSSVVKELVENSIDAGATQILVHTEKGGKELITVSDNGIGIEYDDLELAFMPHSTSKISSALDLSQISTLGFRGEALPSIASVSRIEIFSRYKNSDIGGHLIIDAGKIVLKEKYSCEIGTKISVNNLFYNVPARQKFLKSDNLEEKYIKEKIKNLIFASPNIFFKYTNESGVNMLSEGRGLDYAISDIYSDDIASNMLNVNYQNQYGVAVFGKISNVKISKSNRSYQTLIINGRIVTDKKLQVAVEKAYAPYLMTKTFPLYVLHINMPFDELDINVHPTKFEVRFLDIGRIFSALYNAVMQALHGYDIDRTNEKKTFLNESNRNIIFSPSNSTSINESNPETQNYANKTQKNDDIFIYDIKEHVSNTKPEILNAVTDETFYGKIIGQAFDTYLILELDNVLYVIDQHAAQERIRYDDIIKNFRNDKIQNLLVPYIYKMSTQEEEYIKAIYTSLTDIGFRIEVTDSKLTIFAIPEVLTTYGIEKIINYLFKEIEDLSDKNIGDFVKDLFASRACKGAIKGGDILTRQQIAYLLKMMKTDKQLFPSQCPHGRPCVFEITKEEVEKIFKRIV